MKFKGFTNSALNLGFIDVQLATADNLFLLSCATCGFAAGQMFCCDCNHVYCSSCLLVLEKGSLDAEVPIARCVLCQRTVSCMKVEVHEEFVAQLQFLCPHCQVIVLLKELKRHLYACNTSIGKPAYTRELKATPIAYSDEITSGYTSANSTKPSASRSSKEQIDNNVAGSWLTDIPTTAATPSSGRREPSTAQQELINLEAQISRKSSQTFELAFVTGRLSDGYDTDNYTDNVTFKYAKFFFIYQRCSQPRLTMVVTAVNYSEEVLEYPTFELNVMFKTGTTWLPSKVQTFIKHIQPGMCINCGPCPVEIIPQDTVMKVTLTAIKQ